MFKINQYFEGNVASIAFQTESLPATVGVMDVGEYQFDTAQKETMTVISGQLTVLLPGQTEWQDYRANNAFQVPANTSFKLKVPVQTAYLCTYE